MPTEDDAFAEIVENMGERIHISISQADDSYDVDYDVSGTEDMDAAIGVAMKGLFLMIFESMFDMGEEDLDDLE